MTDEIFYEIIPATKSNPLQRIMATQLKKVRGDDTPMQKLSKCDFCFEVMMIKNRYAVDQPLEKIVEAMNRGQ